MFVCGATFDDLIQHFFSGFSHASIQFLLLNSSSTAIHQSIHWNSFVVGFVCVLFLFVLYSSAYIFTREYAVLHANDFLRIESVCVCVAFGVQVQNCVLFVRSLLLLIDSTKNKNGTNVRSSDGCARSIDKTEQIRSQSDDSEASSATVLLHSPFFTQFFFFMFDKLLRYCIIFLDWLRHGRVFCALHTSQAYISHRQLNIHLSIYHTCSIPLCMCTDPLDTCSIYSSDCHSHT